MEEEPTTLEEAMKIIGKKEKILNLMKENKIKGSNPKEKLSNSETRKQPENHSNYYINNSNYNNKNNNNNNNRDPLKNNFTKNKLNNDTKQKFNNDEIEEITKILSELKLNFCVTV
ncbi:hypothetical protein PIROE2DRAFT_2258 [Piromyces sp. E2]|nr:hypothetical protein PIROE2DRAFT_2258 [Piromyces sp. E2]|eukprot:OUM69826.1 hypothetical protein PIROE2DRAFT_2258 [Piromyces sp. E2]